MTIQSTMLVVTIINIVNVEIKSLQMFNGLVKEFNCFLVLLDMYYHESNSCILHLQGTHYLFILQYQVYVESFKRASSIVTILCCVYTGPKTSSINQTLSRQTQVLS